MLRPELTFRAQDLEISLPGKNATQEELIEFLYFGLNEVVNTRKLGITVESNQTSIGHVLLELGYPFDLQSENFFVEAQFFVLTMMQASRIDLHKTLQEKNREVKAEEKNFTASHSILRSLENISNLLNINDDHNKNSTNILNKLNLVSRTVNTAQHQRLLPESKLSESQLQLCDQINIYLREDFTLRRQMLLKRFDVTIQSFLWSKQVEGRLEETHKQIEEDRASLSILPLPFSVSDAINASRSIAIEHTHRTNDIQTTTSGIKKVLIGDVPDRCGRTNELRVNRMSAYSSKDNRLSKQNRDQKSERGNRNKNKRYNPRR